MAFVGLGEFGIPTNLGIGRMSKTRRKKARCSEEALFGVIPESYRRNRMSRSTSLADKAMGVALTTRESIQTVLVRFFYLLAQRFDRFAFNAGLID